MKILHLNLPHLITILVLSCLKSNVAQVDEPTETTASAVSIVPGSTSLISIPKATSVDLTRDLISGIPSATVTTTNQPQEIVFMTGCSTCNSMTSVLPTVNNTKLPIDSNELSSKDLGAIIGGCAGGLLVIIIVTIWLCIRRRQAKKKRNAKFDIGPIHNKSSRTTVHNQNNRDLQVTTGQSLTQNELKPRHHDRHDKDYVIDSNNSTIKRYNISVGTDAPDNQGPMTPPVILYTDAHNREREEKCLAENGQTINAVQPRNRLVRQASKGARLSKYNFLSQAFSQMRTSYGDTADAGISQQSNYTTNNSNDSKFKDQPISVIAAPQHTQQKVNHDNSTTLPYNAKTAGTRENHFTNHSVYSQTTDSNVDLNRSPLSPPTHSASTFFNDPTRESTITVGTLHAPLFHHQQTPNLQTPPPQAVRREPYLTHLNVTPTFDRDNVKSDEVSKYSTSTMSSPTSNSGCHANNKPYPYF